MTGEPTVVFVHGAWGTPADWDQVTDALREKPLDVVAVDLPTARRSDAGLADDVDCLHAALAGRDGPVTVCAHSYGGVVMTEAAADAERIDHLVYVAAGLPERGQTMLDITAARPVEGGIDLEFRDDGTSMVGGWPRDDGRYSDEAVAFMRDRPRRWWSVAGGITPAASEGWRDHPTTYVLATRDTVIHPETQREMAARADRVVELDCEHFVAAEHPGRLAAILTEVTPGI